MIATTYMPVIMRIIFIIISLFVIDASAQSMSVAGFTFDEMDMTANMEPNIEYDQNGEKCALIKIQTTQKNFMFDVGSLGVTKVVAQNEAHPGEIWLYVPEGVKKISIQHPQLGSINNYDLGRSLKKAKTYILELTTDQVNTIIVDYENSQKLQVEIEPAEAEFYLNGMKQSIDKEGKCELDLSFGRYAYLAKAQNYHPEENNITINDKENAQKLKIKLKQAFGYLTVNAPKEYDGANVYVDGNLIGQLPIRNYHVGSNRHEIMVYKKLFEPYNQVVNISDSAFVEITPHFEPNYGITTLTVADKGAQIFDNGELIATGNFNGRLEAGEHNIEVRKVSHYPTSKQLTVKKGEKIELALESPKPIVGTLEFSTTPPGAEVIVDGVNVGKTPYINSQMLIGKHEIVVRKQGYRNETKTITVEENQTTRDNISLTDFCTATIYTEPRNASISIDGGERSSSPYQLNVVAGEYTIKVWDYGYATQTKKMKLDGNTKDFTIKLYRNYIRKNEFYLQAGYNVMTCAGMNLGLGFYAANVNIEANYVLHFGKSDNIYWIDRTGESEPLVATYKPQVFNVKAGYGIRVHNRFRITPQVGCQYVGLKENADIASIYTNGTYDIEETGAGRAKALSGIAGVRVNMALASCLGVSITPEYVFGISKSAGFKAISGISPKVKKYSEGFNVNISLNLFF